MSFIGSKLVFYNKGGCLEQCLRRVSCHASFIQSVSSHAFWLYFSRPCPNWHRVHFTANSNAAKFRFLFFLFGLALGGKGNRFFLLSVVFVWKWTVFALRHQMVYFSPLQFASFGLLFKWTSGRPYKLASWSHITLFLLSPTWESHKFQITILSIH